MSEPHGTPAAATQEWHGEASAAWNAPAKPGVLRRYWWVGCLTVVLVIGLLAGIAGLLMMLQNRTPTPAPSPTQSSQSPEPSTSPAPTPTGPRSDDLVTTGLVPLGPGAVTHRILTTTGDGEVSISQEWASASEIETAEGKTMIEPENGEYLVLTVQLKVQTGEVYNNPYYVEVHTEDGGVVTPALGTYSQPDDAGIMVNQTNIPAGNTVTMRVLYDIPRSDRLTIKWSQDKRGAVWEVEP